MVDKKDKQRDGKKKGKKEFGYGVVWPRHSEPPEPRRTERKPPPEQREPGFGPGVIWPRRPAPLPPTKKS